MMNLAHWQVSFALAHFQVSFAQQENPLSCINRQDLFPSPAKSTHGTQN